MLLLKTWQWFEKDGVDTHVCLKKHQSNFRPSFDYKIFISGNDVRIRKSTAGFSALGGYHKLWKLEKASSNLEIVICLK